MTEPNYNQLFCLTEGRKHDCEYHLIFLHGLNGHWKTTWMHDKKAENSFWPNWIGKDHNDICVWTYCYNAKMVGFTRHRVGLTKHGEMLADEIEQELRDSSKPILLAAHSMGGLIGMTAARACYLRSARHLEWERLFARFEGFFFMATPHKGSWAANLPTILFWIGLLGLPSAYFFGINYLSYLFGFFFLLSIIFHLRGNRHLKEMRPKNKRLMELTDWFKQIRLIEEWDVTILKEARGTKLAFGYEIVTDEAADPGLIGVVGRSLNLDHSEICKPRDRESPIYQKMMDFIQSVRGKMEERRRQENELQDAQTLLTQEKEKNRRLQESIRLSNPNPSLPRLGTRDQPDRFTKITRKNGYTGTLISALIIMTLYFLYGFWQDFLDPYLFREDVKNGTGRFSRVISSFDAAIKGTWQNDIVQMDKQGVDSFFDNEFLRLLNVEKETLDDYKAGIGLLAEEATWKHRFIVRFLDKEFREAAEVAAQHAQSSSAGEDKLTAWNYAGLSYRLACFQHQIPRGEAYTAFVSLKETVEQEDNWKALGEEERKVMDTLQLRINTFAPEKRSAKAVQGNAKGKQSTSIPGKASPPSNPAPVKKSGARNSK